ncbi:MAG: biopolymer transporter ExbD [Rubricoccaceae bacterium]|nr:biopolymer transporter ExbD [Rubricoccaceae bacterium]
MTLNFSTGRKPLSVFSLAGMTDIVLLLLVFFLLTSSFVTQYGLQVDLPRVNATTPLEQQYVAVSITSDGRFFVDREETTATDLVPTIERLRGDRVALAVYADESATIWELANVASAGNALNMRVAIATDIIEEGN